MKHIFVGILLGFGLQYIQSMIGMLTLEPAIDYYAEVHQSKFNSIIHTIFMPYTMYGMFMWIPGLLGLQWYNARKLRESILIGYLAHYMRISLTGAFLTFLLYLYPYSRSEIDYYKLGPNKSFVKGIAFSVGALLIQEFIGHYLGGDPASRPEAIPNAILYAPYYSSCWFL